jgi:hypothetical protein
MNESRRKLLRAGGATISAWLATSARDVRARAGERAASSLPVSPGVPKADVEITLRATPARVSLNGKQTQVWRFEGHLDAGPSDALTASDGYLGPVIRARPGQRVAVRFQNRLDEPSIVHWHGLDVSEENDGHPRHAVPGGGTYAYSFRVTNRPGTYWYHPHAHQRTGAQVHAGLAGLLIVEDDDSKGILPSGASDLSLVLQDRQLDANGQFIYNPNGMTGFLGDLILVNAKPTPTFKVKAGTYRLRLLNGSNARIYKLGWNDGSPLVVIGSDGGLLETPVRKPYVMLAPGERAEIWVDFGKAPAGPDVWLESRSFLGGAGGMMGMMGPGMGGGMGMGMNRGMGMGGASSGVPNGSAFRVCRFTVTGRGERLPLPRTLSRIQFRPDQEVVNLGSPRRFDVTMAMMRFTLNGRTFGMDDLAPNEHIRKGTTEDWEFSNLVGMMAMPHPLHIHGGQFQIVDRSVAPGAGPAVDSVREGRVEEGWKDTFLLMPGERVRVRVCFEHHSGLFLYHCHNLEHEDMGMMRNFRVEV